MSPEEAAFLAGPVIQFVVAELRKDAPKLADDIAALLSPNDIASLLTSYDPAVVQRLLLGAQYDAVDAAVDAELAKS